MRKIKRSYYILFIGIVVSIAIALGCNQQAEKEDMSVDGNHVTKKVINKDSALFKYTEYYPSKKVKSEYYIKDNKLNGIETDYFPNGKVQSLGNWTLGKKDGVFKYFDSIGNLRKIIKYLPLGDTSISKPNEVISLDEKGDTLLDGSSVFYKLYSTGDTIKQGKDRYNLKIVLKGHVFNSAFVKICDFDENFHSKSNESCDEIDMDNFVLELSPRNYKLGENIIRGVIVNYEKSNSMGIDTGKRIAIYFTDKFYVVP